MNTAVIENDDRVWVILPLKGYKCSSSCFVTKSQKALLSMPPPLCILKSRSPLDDIAAMTETCTPLTINCFEMAGFPLRLYPFLLIIFLQSKPVSSAKTSISAL